jgi:hypothetical protein
VNTIITRQLILIMAVITAYIVWLILFLLVVERWLRHLTEGIFGVTIRRDFARLEGPSRNVNLLDGLFMFSWTVAQPASLSRRFTIGLLRFAFWLAALMLPIVFAVLLYLKFQPLLTDK